MSVDFRTRVDDSSQQGALDTDDFFSRQLPAAIERNRHLLATGIARLPQRPFAIEIEGDAWSLMLDAGEVSIRRGVAPAAAHTRLSGDDFSGLVRDWYTPMTFFTGGSLDMVSGNLGDFLNAWLILRGALDSRPIHTPGAVVPRDRQGRPLDFTRGFTLDDDPLEMSHFLHEAGYLHLRGVFSADEMAEVSRDMDAAAPGYFDGDGRSWWARTASGDNRLVRMQGFDTHSETTARLLRSEQFLRLGSLSGDRHTHQGLQSNRIEALVKPLGVVKGISDLPWHKDCSLGRHSYDCCSLTVGISVTGAGPGSGQLHVLAGSHRALMWPALIDTARYDFADIPLPTTTGDVTVHLSCTAHMSEAPTERERRVMYTSFRLPACNTEAAEASLQRISAVREGAYTTVSQ